MYSFSFLFFAARCKITMCYCTCWCVASLTLEVRVFFPSLHHITEINKIKIILDRLLLQYFFVVAIIMYYGIYKYIIRCCILMRIKRKYISLAHTNIHTYIITHMKYYHECVRVFHSFSFNFYSFPTDTYIHTYIYKMCSSLG